MPSLEDEFNVLLDRSIAVNTKNVYKSGLKLFKEFLYRHNLTFTLPFSLDHVLNFILYMSKLQYAHKTIVSYVESLSFILKCNSYVDVTKHFLIKKLLEGHRRYRPCKDSRLPVTIGLLSRLLHILPSTCTNLYEANLFRAMFTLAFWGLLRVSEFTQSRNKDLDRVISITDVRLDHSKKIVILVVRWSKTDQRGLSVTLRIGAQRQELICPYASLSCFLGIRPSISGPLFVHFDRSPVTRYQFSKVLEKALLLINGDNKRILSHSFRLGGATYLASLGKSEEDIKKSR